MKYEQKRPWMVRRLSESAVKEIQGYYSGHYDGRAQMLWDVARETERMIQECGFVAVSERGNVIHANRRCGTGFHTLVPIDIALEYGYNRLCKICTCGTYAAQLFRERTEKSVR